MSGQELARLQELFPAPAWAAALLLKLADFAEASADVSGMFVFGSVARRTATNSSDVDVCMLLERSDRLASVQGALIELFKAQTLLAMPMPRKVRFFLSDRERSCCKLGVGLVADLQSKAEYFLTSELCATDVPRIVLCDKRGALHSELPRLLGPDKARLMPPDYSPAWQAQQFLIKFDACASNVHDAYQCALWLTLLRHHLLVLEMISNGVKEFLYRPHRAFERFPELLTRQLPASPPVHVHQRQRLLFAHAVAFAHVCAQLRGSLKDSVQQQLPQQFAVLDALCGTSLQRDDFLRVIASPESRRVALHQALQRPRCNSRHWLPAAFVLLAFVAVFALRALKS